MPVSDWVRTTWRQLARLPAYEQDPGFRDTLRTFSRAGMQVGGGIGIAGVLIYVLVQVTVLGDPLRWTSPASSVSVVVLSDKLAIVGLCAALVGAARRGCSLQTGRLLVAGTLFGCAAASLHTDVQTGKLAVEYLTAMYVLAVGIAPFRPWQTFGAGVGLGGLLYGLGTYGPVLLSDGNAILNEGHLVHVGVVTLILTGISTVLYVSRYTQYRARRTAERLREEKADLEAAKSRFFANLSHELRTPLTLILGPIQDALDGRHGTLPDSLRRQLETTRDQTERLQTLVDQLLDLARLDEGRMDVAARPVPVGPFLERMTGLFTSMADRKDIDLRMETPDEQVQVCADPDALEQIVANLLSNALKYTPEAGTVRVEARSVDDEHVELAVRDSGPGLPDAVQSTLFGRYAEAAPSEDSRLDVGSGIGLAIVRQYVDRHGGTVEVDSEAGFGTEFTVRLPQTCDPFPPEDRADASGHALPSEAVAADRVPPAPPSEPLPAENTEGEANRGTVLVVDDESAVRDYLRDVLSPPYTVRTAADGDEGLEAAQSLEPDLVISDVMMPKRDGFALCRALRADENLRTIPIILLTVRTEEESKLEGLEQGADAYLNKPFHPEALRQRVENLIDVRRYLRGQTDGSEASDDDPAEPSAFVEAVRAVIREQMGNGNFGVDWLADAVDLSPRQLQRRLQEETGLSAAAYIRTVRLRHAADLLAEGDVDTVKAAAGAVGYRDPSHFSRLFREAHGVPPSEYQARR